MFMLTSNLEKCNGQLELIPPITASQDVFFYQDGKDANRFGKIVLVDQGDSAVLILSGCYRQRNIY